ncbi:transposase, MuDR, MULE transposase domain protein [Tanacetum coccineum]
MRDNSRIYKVKDIQHDMTVDWKIDISYKRAWGGSNMTLNLMNNSHEDSFAQLSYYCYNLKLANEGTLTRIHTYDQGRFEMLYVRFGFAIRSFLRYMRPLIIIDGAHLKGNYLGTNLLAVGMDGNNQIVPIATSVSQGETGESWTWFLRRLKEQIGEPLNLCIISERHHAIILACSTIFDNAFHGYCDHHLMMNCNLKEALDHELTDWVAAKVQDRMLKSANWCVKGIDHLKVYQVCDVCRFSGLTNCSLWAKPWFTKTTLKGTYQEMVYHLKDPSLWHAPNDLQLVLPSVMNKRQARRPKNKDRILSKGEISTPSRYTSVEGLDEDEVMDINETLYYVTAMVAPIAGQRCDTCTLKGASTKDTKGG